MQGIGIIVFQTTHVANFMSCRTLPNAKIVNGYAAFTYGVQIKKALSTSYDIVKVSSVKECICNTESSIVICVAYTERQRSVGVICVCIC